MTRVEGLVALLAQWLRAEVHAGRIVAVTNESGSEAAERLCAADCSGAWVQRVRVDCGVTLASVALGPWAKMSRHQGDLYLRPSVVTRFLQCVSACDSSGGPAWGQALAVRVLAELVNRGHAHLPPGAASPKEAATIEFEHWARRVPSEAFGFAKLVPFDALWLWPDAFHADSPASENSYSPRRQQAGGRGAL